MITFEQVKQDEAVRTYIQKADDTLGVIGYTEHAFAHVGRCAETVRELLTRLGYDSRTVELGQIAAYLHDIGNMINRTGHAQSGALLAFRILDKMGMQPGEITQVVTAIGHHDEETAYPVTAITSALILADKSDVRYTRVRLYDPATQDMHDRVNYAVKRSELALDEETGTVTLVLEIDAEVSTVTEYFEIFLGRMLLCRKAAAFFGLEFKLSINGANML
ncbi:MAG: HD domain-containing protein [Oscillospiraceae bacterium]